MWSVIILILDHRTQTQPQQHDQGGGQERGCRCRPIRLTSLTRVEVPTSPRRTFGGIRPLDLRRVSLDGFVLFDHDVMIGTRRVNILTAW